MSFGRKSNKDNAERVALLRDSDSEDEDFFLKGPSPASDKVRLRCYII